MPKKKTDDFDDFEDYTDEKPEKPEIPVKKKEPAIPEELDVHEGTPDEDPEDFSNVDELANRLKEAQLILSRVSAEINEIAWLLK